MKLSFRLMLCLSALLFITAGAASADTLITYQLTGPITASFELPVNPVVTIFTLGFDFQVTPINLMINGVASSDFLVFYNTFAGGAFGAFSCGSCKDLSLAGPQLYSGSEDSPTMLALNNVSLTNFGKGTPAGTISTSGTVGVPEPSAVVLLGIGLLAVGLLAFRFKPGFAITAS